MVNIHSVQDYSGQSVSKGPGSEHGDLVYFQVNQGLYTTRLPLPCTYDVLQQGPRQLFTHMVYYKFLQIYILLSLLLDTYGH